MSRWHPVACMQMHDFIEKQANQLKVPVFGCLGTQFSRGKCTNIEFFSFPRLETGGLHLNSHFGTGWLLHDYLHRRTKWTSQINSPLQKDIVKKIFIILTIGQSPKGQYILQIRYAAVSRWCFQRRFNDWFKLIE